MVLRGTKLLICAAALVAGCVQPNTTPHRKDASGDGPALPLDGPTDVTEGGERPAGPDSGAPDGAAPDTFSPADAECTPQTTSCSADGRSVRTCDGQGRWTAPSSCAAQTECSGGVCLCSPGACDQGSIHQVAGITLPGALAAGGGALFVGVDGAPSSIRRFDLQSTKESVVHMGTTDFTLYALDADAVGNLIWCSDVHTTAYRTGELVNGAMPLDTGPCTHVRRRDDLVYYASDALYRRALAGDTRQMVTREPMSSFELAGDALYFVGQVGQESYLKRLSLADPTKVETVVSRSDAVLQRLVVDARHAYVTADSGILRAAQGGGPAETFWQDPTDQVWGLAQTETHLYWSTTTPGSTGCASARVWRKPKAGGPEAVLSTVTGHCAGEVVVLGPYLYTVVGVTPPGSAPAELLRIKL
jgi:hypothetical protein